MNKEALTMEYLLCVLDDEGKLPTFSTEKEICFYAAQLIELIDLGWVVLEGKKLQLADKGSEPPVYLEPMFEIVKKSEGKKVADFAGNLTFNLTGKPRRKMLEACLEVMEEANLLETATKKGLLGTKEYRTVKAEEKDRVIQKIRAEFLEEGQISEETVLLGCLLDKTSLLKKYFSAYEAKMLKQRLKELRKAPENKLINEMIDSVEALIAVIAATA